MSASEHPIFSPGRLGPLALRNRVVKCGTNEGMSRDGLVTDALIDFHRDFAVGGVAMTTLAYCSVAPEGRTFRHQIHMREEALPGLRRFAEAIHAEGALASIQLGHAGWFANPRASGSPPIGPSRTFSPHAQAFSRAMRDEDFERTTAAFVDAARLAEAAGFDALELHMGHGYLLSQFLTPWNNRRRDEWGGSLENRSRYPRHVARAVRNAVGPGVAVYAKLNMDDGFKGGLTLDEGVQVGRWFDADASLDALQLTGGHTTRTPMFLMRGAMPLKEMLENERSRVRRLGMQLVAPFLLKPVPFEEAFFLPSARRFREALSMPLMLLAGLNELASMDGAIREGFELVALGRALIRDPDLLVRMQRGELTASRCDQCNQCIIEMDRGGTHCVYRPRAAAEARSGSVLA